MPHSRLLIICENSFGTDRRMSRQTEVRTEKRSRETLNGPFGKRQEHRYEGWDDELFELKFLLFQIFNIFFQWSFIPFLICRYTLFVLVVKLKSKLISFYWPGWLLRYNKNSQLARKWINIWVVFALKFNQFTFPLLSIKLK